MKPFSIIITWRDPNNSFKFKYNESIDADSLVELLSKFNMTVLKLNEQVIMESERFKAWGRDDDIPF